VYGGGGGGGRGIREPVPLADRVCVAHMGSLVRSGRGSGIVIGTGTETELGVVFSMVQDVRPRASPLWCLIYWIGRSRRSGRRCS
jgi:Ca2+-transporting ATPase